MPLGSQCVSASSSNAEGEEALSLSGDRGVDPWGNQTPPLSRLSKPMDSGARLQWTGAFLYNIPGGKAWGSTTATALSTSLAPDGAKTQMPLGQRLPDGQVVSANCSPNTSSGVLLQPSPFPSSSHLSQP